MTYRARTYRESHPGPIPRPVAPEQREALAALLEQLAAEVRAGHRASLDVRVRGSIDDHLDFVRVSVAATEPVINQAEHLSGTTEEER